MKATGKAGRTLAATSSLDVAANLTFTPDRGDVRTSPVKLTLKQA